MLSGDEHEKSFITSGPGFIQSTQKLGTINNHTVFKNRVFMKNTDIGPQIKVRKQKLFSYFSTKTFAVGTFEHPKYMFKLMGKKIITISHKKS